MVITHHGGQCFKVTFGDLTLVFDPISKGSALSPVRFGADGDVSEVRNGASRNQKSILRLRSGQEIKNQRYGRSCQAHGAYDEKGCGDVVLGEVQDEYDHEYGHGAWGIGRAGNGKTYGRGYP